ncbi:MAG: hypothetical protein HY774_20430 [Acidobacteria bacterium]|nr:hypothetical protein [Acidobacteriota bacterium]
MGAGTKPHGCRNSTTQTKLIFRRPSGREPFFGLDSGGCASKQAAHRLLSTAHPGENDLFGNGDGIPAERALCPSQIGRQ